MTGRFDRLRGAALAVVSLAVVLAAASLWAARSAPIDLPPLEAHRGTLRKTLLLSGSITSSAGDSLVVPVTPSWRLAIKWLEKEGAAVKPGDAVVRFDTGTLDNDITSAEIDLVEKVQDDALKNAEAKAKSLDLALVAEKARIELAKAQLDADVPSAIRPAREYEDKQLALAKAQSAYDVASKALATHEATIASEARQRAIDIQAVHERLNRAQRALEGMELRATRHGTVVYGTNPQTDRKVQIGDTVFTGWPVASVPDPLALVIEAGASEAETAFLQVGQRASVVLDAHPERHLTGTVQSIGQSGEPFPGWGKSAYYRVVLTLDQLDSELMKPGMSARSEVVVAEIADAMLIPLAALARDRDGLFVSVDGTRLAVKPLGYDAFHAAVAPDSIREGTVLRSQFGQAGE